MADNITWIACAWKVQGLNSSLQVQHAPRLEHSDPYYAVRYEGSCLNKDGEMEWEPRPSSRTEDFYNRCRFDNLDDAMEAASKYIREHVHNS